MDKLYIDILRSSIDNDKYSIGKKILKIKNVIGRGLHGLIIEIDDYIVKLYSKKNNEIDFYNIIINDNLKLNNLTSSCATGILTKPYIFNNLIYNNSYILIMPIYYPLTNMYVNLKDENFLLNLIVKIFKLLNYIYIHYNYINLDLKMLNIMYDLKSNDIVLIDFSLIIKDTNNKIYIPNKYYKQWPSNICFIKNIPIYSMYVCLIDIIYDNYIELNNKNLNNIITLLIFKKYSYFFIKIVKTLKENESSNMTNIIDKIEKYNIKRYNKWYKNLLSFHYKLNIFN